MASALATTPLILRALPRRAPPAVCRLLHVTAWRGVKGGMKRPAPSKAADDDEPFMPPNYEGKTRAERLAMEQGYFHEMMQLQKTKGKPFHAEAGLAPAATAPTFPSVTADALLGGEISLPAAAHGKITLVALSFKQFGFVQLPSYIEPFQAEAAALQAKGCGSASKGKGGASSKPAQAQVVQLSAMEGGFIANLLKGSVTAGLLKATPASLHATSAVFVGDVDPLCNGLEVDNRLLGHAFLLDADAKVRWRACGAATPDEVKGLKGALAALFLAPLTE